MGYTFPKPAMVFYDCPINGVAMAYWLFGRSFPVDPALVHRIVYPCGTVEVGALARAAASVAYRE